LQAQLQFRPLDHRLELRLVLCRALDLDPRAQEFAGPHCPLCHIGQPPLGRFHGAHRRVIPPDHEFMPALPAIEMAFPQHLDPLQHDGLIGPRGPEPEGRGRRLRLELGRNRQQRLQRLIGRNGLVRHPVHQVRQPVIQRPQDRAQFA